MEDRTIDDLLSGYSKGLGHSRHKKPQVTATKLPLWKPVMVTAVGAAILGAFVFIPRRVEAAPIDKVLQAFNSAHFWSSTTWMRSLAKPAPWQLSGNLIHLDDAFQQNGPASTPGFLTIITKSGFQFYDYQGMPCILKIPLKESEWLKNVNDPMKQAIYYSKFKGKELVRKDGGMFKGIETFSLTVTSKQGKVLFEAIVDKSNNLPLQFTMGIGGKNDAAEIRTEFQYRQPKELVVLSPNSKKEIIEIEKEMPTLAEKWNSVKPNLDKFSLLSSSISPDGTIWIASRVEGDLVAAGRRTLSLDNANYTSATCQTFDGLQIKDPLLSAIQGVTINQFIPIYDKSPLPKSVTVKVGPYFSYKGDLKKPALNSILCPLSLEPYRFPGYMPTILFSVNTNLMEREFWRRRADARKKLGDFKGAIEGYMKSYEKDKSLHTFFSASFNNLKSAAECYDKLGDNVKAQKLRKMIPTGKQPHF
jgi:hypothetical protein